MADDFLATLASITGNKKLVPPKPVGSESQAEALRRAAEKLGIQDPADLGAIISFETGGTYNPHKVGGAGNRYKGLIQFGPEEQKTYYNPNDTFETQVEDGVVRFFQDRYKQAYQKTKNPKYASTKGATLEDLYTTVIAGNPAANRDATDDFGTSARSGTQRILKEHRPKVLQKFFGGQDVTIAQESEFLKQLGEITKGTTSNGSDFLTTLSSITGGSKPEGTPTPEKPDTLIAQIESANDPKVRTRFGVLATEPTQATLFANQPNFKPFKTKKGTLWLNTAKIYADKKLKLKNEKDLRQYLKNPKALAKLIGIAEDVGRNTRGTAVVAKKGGIEQASAIVRSPETAEQQIAAYQDQFPDAEIGITTSDEVAKSRQQTDDELNKAYQTIQTIDPLLQASEAIKGGKSLKEYEDNQTKLTAEYQAWLKKNGYPDDRNSIDSFNTERQAEVEKQNFEANEANRIKYNEAVAKWKPPTPVPVQKVVQNAPKQQETSAPPAAKGIETSFNYNPNDKRSYSEQELDATASNFAGQLGIDADIVRDYIKRKGFTGGNESESERATQAKAGVSQRRRLDAAAVADLVKIREFTVKKRAEIEKETQEKLTQYTNELEEGMPTSVARIRTEFDMGGMSEDEFLKRIAEEKTLAKNLRSQSLDANALDLRGITATRLGVPDSKVGGDVDIKENNKLIDSILERYPTLTAWKKEQDRLQKEYQYRPLAAPLEFAKGMFGAVPKAVASVLKSADLAMNLNPLVMMKRAYEDGKPFQFKEGVLSDIGNGINKYVDSTLNRDFDDNKAIRVISDTMGQALTQVAAGVLSGGATVPTALGFTMGASSQFDEANKFKNATDEQKAVAWAVGGLAAVPDAVIFSKGGVGGVLDYAKGLTKSLLARFGVKYGEKVAAEMTEIAMKSFAKRFMTEAPKNAAFEVVQEVSENKINNAVASITYDPSEKRIRDANPLHWNEEDTWSAIGAIVGGGSSAVIQAKVESIPETEREDFIDELNSKIDTLVKQKSITPEQAAKAKREIVTLEPVVTPVAEKSKVKVEPKAEQPVEKVVETPIISTNAKGNFVVTVGDKLGEIKTQRNDIDKELGTISVINARVSENIRQQGIATQMYETLRDNLPPDIKGIRLSDITTSDAIPAIYKKLGAVKQGDELIIPNPNYKPTKFSNKPLKEVVAEGEKEYGGVDDFFAVEEAPTEVVDKPVEKVAEPTPVAKKLDAGATIAEGSTVYKGKLDGEVLSVKNGKAKVQWSLPDGSLGDQIEYNVDELSTVKPSAVEAKKKPVSPPAKSDAQKVTKTIGGKTYVGEVYHRESVNKDFVRYTKLNGEEGNTPLNDSWKPVSDTMMQATNASGESAASLEAQSRLKGEQARGEYRVVVDTRSGIETKLPPIDGVDRFNLQPWEQTEWRGGNRDGEIIDRGTATRAYTRKKDTMMMAVSSPDIIDSKGNIDYERAKDVAGRIERGDATIRRLNPSGERGRIKGGQRNVEASIILAANERASEKSGSRIRPVERQERVLEEYAKREGIWFDVKEFTRQQQGYIGKGQEAYVHRADDKSVYKLIDYKKIDEQFTPQDFIDNRLSAFNYIFPETAYELTGFTRDSGGDFRFIVKQPFIQDVVYTTASERQAFMKSKGFEMIGKYGEQFANQFYHVSDLHEKNALKADDGTIYVIDAVVKAKPVSDFEITEKSDTSTRAISELDANQASFKAARTISTKRLDEIINWNTDARIAEPGIIAVDPIEGAEFLRRLMGENTSFYGVMADPAQIAQVRETLDKMIAHSGSPNLKRLKRLIDTALKHDGTVIFAMTEDTAKHERKHRFLFHNRKSGRNVTEEVEQEIINSAGYKKALTMKWGENYSTFLQSAKVEEYITAVANEEWSTLGVTNATEQRESNRMLIRFAMSFAETNKGDGTVRDLMVGLATEMAYVQEYLKDQEVSGEQKEDTQEVVDSNVEPDGGKKARPDDEGTKTNRPDELKYVPSGEQKFSKTPQTMQDAGFDVPAKPYISATNEGQNVFAHKLLDKGVSAAQDWFDAQIKAGADNNGATTAVGLNLMKSYGFHGNLASMNKVADALVPYLREAGQAIQAMGIINIFDPKSAGAYASKYVKQRTGKDLTKEQKAKAETIATQMSEAVQVDGVTEALRKDLENDLAEITKERDDLAKALDDLTAKYELDLADAKAGISKLTRTRRPTVAKTLSDIRQKRAQTNKILDVAFGQTETMMMAVKTPLSPNVKDALVDWATDELDKDLRKGISIGDFYNKLDARTNNALDINEVVDIHAQAMTRLIEPTTTIERLIKKDATAAEYQKALESQMRAKNRQEHVKIARKHIKDTTSEFAKSLTKKPDRFVTAIIKEGVNQGFSDEAIYHALARRSMSPRESEASLHQEYPEVNARRVMAEANRLVTIANQSVKDAKIQADNAYALTETQLDALKAEQKINDTVKRRIKKEADQFYDSLSKSNMQTGVEGAVNYRKANLLTAFKTHMVNVTSNLTFAAAEEVLARNFAALADIAASFVTGQRTVQMISGIGIFKGIQAQGFHPKEFYRGIRSHGISRDGLKKAFRQMIEGDKTLKNANEPTGIEKAWSILRTGDTMEAQHKSQYIESHIREKGSSTGGKIAPALTGGRLEGSVGYYAGSVADAYINMVFRTLQAEDALFKVFAFRRSIEEQAQTRAQSEMGKRVSLTKRPYKERYKELIENPTAAMQVEAAQFADDMTYQNTNPISNMISRAKDIHYAAKAAIEIPLPFDRTPTNVILRTLEYTPLGFAKAAVDVGIGKAKPHSLKQKFDVKYRHAIEEDLGTEEFFKLNANERRMVVDEALSKAFTRQQQQRFARAFGRGATGLAVTIPTGFILAAAGLLTGIMSGDDDDKAERGEFFGRLKQGVENKSLLIPGVGRFVLGDDPWSKALVMGATMYEQAALAQKQRKDALSSVWDGTAETLSDAMFEQPLLREAKDSINAKTTAGDKLGSFARTWVPASGMAGAASDVFDEKDRRTTTYSKAQQRGKTFWDIQSTGFVNAFTGRIPIARNYFAQESNFRNPNLRGGTVRRIIRMLDVNNTRPPVKDDSLVNPDVRRVRDNLFKMLEKQ